MPTDASPFPSLSARRIVPAPRAALFAFLSDLENQCMLAHDHTKPLVLSGPPGARHSAIVGVPGGLGLRRTADARIVAAAEPNELVTDVALGKTLVRFHWTLTPLPAATGVELVAELPRVGLIDRALLSAAGRGRLARRLHDVLDTLAEIVRVASVESDLDQAGVCVIVLARHARRTARLAAA
jgi:hypothetical protein